MRSHLTVFALILGGAVSLLLLIYLVWMLVRPAEL